MQRLSRKFTGFAALVMLVGLLVVPGTSASAADVDRGAAGENFMAIMQSGNTVPPSGVSGGGVVWMHLNSDNSMNWSVYFTTITNPMKGVMQLGRYGQAGQDVDKLWDSATTGPFIGTYSGTMANGTMTASSFSGPWQGKSMSDFVTQVKSGNVKMTFYASECATCGVSGQIISADLRDLNGGLR